MVDLGGMGRGRGNPNWPSRGGWKTVMEGSWMATNH